MKLNDAVIHHDNFGHALDDLKKQDLPLLIYGAGNLAEAVFKKLNENNIRVAGFFTDNGGEEFLGYSVVSISNLAFYGKQGCNVILGFAAAYRKKEFLYGVDAVNKVFELDNPFEHHKKFDHDFFYNNRQSFSEIYHLLEDELSRESFIAFVNCRVNQSSSYAVNVSPADIDEFYNDVFKLSHREVFLDVGAYRGGSIERFLMSVCGKYKKIIAIEPETENFRFLNEFVQTKKLDNISLHQIGCWYEKGRLAFNNEENKCCRIEEEADFYIDVDSLDNICEFEDEISVINIGISTALCEIVQGASSIIKADLPKIIVFMGAAKEELFLIPKLIKNIDSRYGIYFRFQSSMASRLFLYAIPRL